MGENWLILIKRIAKLRIKTSQDGSFELRRSRSFHSLRGKRKKGRERGMEKSTKEGKGKGAPAIRAGVFVIRPPFSQLIR